MLDKPLERRDAVVMLSRLLGEEEEAEAYEADEDTVYQTTMTHITRILSMGNS